MLSRRNLCVRIHIDQMAEAHRHLLDWFKEAECEGMIVLHLRIHIFHMCNPMSTQVQVSSSFTHSASVLTVVSTIDDVD